MQRSVVSAVAFALLCASQCSSALAAEHEPGCAGGECLDASFEETALVQTKLQAHRRQTKLEHSKQLPSLSNLTDAIASVTDAVSGTAASAILDAVAAVKSQLVAIEQDIEPYIKLVNETSEILEKGLAGILAEAFGVVIEGIPEEYEEKAIDLLKEADSVWTMVVNAIQSASSTVDSLLSLLGSSADDIRTQVNATMQSVLSAAQGVLEPIEMVEEAVAAILNTTAKEGVSDTSEAVAAILNTTAKEGVSNTSEAASLLQEAARSRSEVASLLQATRTKLDPGALLDTVNEAVAEAVQQVSGFASGFSGLFGTIEDDIIGVLQKTLSSDDVAKVTEAIEDLQSTATDIANEVVGSTSEVLSSIAEATAEVADAVGGVKSMAVGQPLVRWGLGITAAAVFTAMGI